MKKIIAVIIASFLLIFSGCKKESEYKNWTINERNTTFRLEYNSINQLIKYSRFINDTLSSFYTFNYSDTSLIHKHFEKDSVLIEQIFYVLDSNKRAVESYSSSVNHSADTIVYSASGFPSYIQLVDYDYSFIFQNNGTDIISETVDMFSTTFTPSEILSTVSLPNYFSMYATVIPSFTGTFGELNKHLIDSYSSYVAGPGGRIEICRFEYKFDSEGYVTEVIKYQKEYPRYESEPEYGTISYIKYQYYFE